VDKKNLGTLLVIKCTHTSGLGKRHFQNVTKRGNLEKGSNVSKRKNESLSKHHKMYGYNLNTWKEWENGNATGGGFLQREETKLLNQGTRIRKGRNGQRRKKKDKGPSRGS